MNIKQNSASIFSGTSASLPESFASIPIPPYTASGWRKMWAFAGPGLMVAVGYMDPGNWATDIAGGSKFGYSLLIVILVSNLFAIILQHLALKLGIVTGKDLAQACNTYFSRRTSMILWILCEIAIAACDLAEVLGSAIALQLLFNIPLMVGIAITVFDVLLLLLLQNKGFRKLEGFVAALIFTIFICFGYQIWVSKPIASDVLKGFLPNSQIFTNPQMLYIAIGILGATVMPHNLYLHSSIVQTRNYAKTEKGKKQAIKYATLDTVFSLGSAFFVNAAILIVSAATFHYAGKQHVADITEAHQLLNPLLGVQFAGTFFAVALLASGQNATLTGTLAGQIVMEGFLNIRLKPWLRRLITRLIAVVPAMLVAIYYGEKATTDLLVLSQVILSLQLSFAIVPLVFFTNNKKYMGNFANSTSLKIISSIITVIIIILNSYLLIQTFVA